MIDLLKRKLGPELPETPGSTSPEQPSLPNEFGHTALLGGGYEYIDIYSNDSYRPNFVDNERRRGTELVDMDAHGEVTVAPGEEKRIATFGLGGCTAVAIAIEMPDGTKRGYVQHYSPLNKSYSATALTEALSNMPTNAIAGRAVIMTPGEWAQDPSAKWAMVARDEILTGLLTIVAQKGLGPEADIQVYPYSEMRSTDRYEQGTLMIEFRASGETAILAEAMPVRLLGEAH